MSTAFGCTIQGIVTDDDVVFDVAEQVVQAGVDEAGLSDTTGITNSAQVRCLFIVRAAIGDKPCRVHMHNNARAGLTNCLAAYDVGVRTFDSSLGGLGGCPY